MSICLDCNKQLKSSRSIRCRSCDNTHRYNNSEYKENIRSKMLGNNYGKSIQHSLNITGKKNPMYGRSGKNSPRWNGGRTPLIERIRKLLESQDWKKSVFERDNYTCQECFQRGTYLEAHHIKRLKFILDDFLKIYSQFSIIEDIDTLVRLAISYTPFWDLSNGQTLCKDCHNKTKGTKVR